jgi:6-phosphogluconolactonase (cycloisomerase 2 family)
MRMKFYKTGQLLLVSSVSLLVAGLFTACSTLTVDFVYVTSAKAAGPNNYGVVDVFEVNSESGFMRQIPTSPFPSGGRNPVAAAVSTDFADLYVVNKDDNTIVQFIIGNDGKLYPQNTVNTPGIFPTALAVAGSFLYVVDTYQPLPTCSTASPCSGSVAVYPVAKDDSLGAPAVNPSLSASYWPLALPSGHLVTPTAITAQGSTGNIYVTAYDATTPNASNAGYVFGFSTGSDGTLTAIAGSPWLAGTQPSAIASDANGHVYVTDAAKSVVLSYSVAATSGVLNLQGSFPTGNGPSAIVVDASGSFAYVANAQDATITAYSVSNGALTHVGSYTTGTQPVAIGIDPSLHQYLYTANFLGNNVNGFQLSSTDGTLILSQNSPYTANAQPTSIAAVPHGSQTKTK